MTLFLGKTGKMTRPTLQGRHDVQRSYHHPIQLPDLGFHPVMMEGGVLSLHNNTPKGKNGALERRRYPH
jgi:hypothetical protein